MSLSLRHRIRRGVQLYPVTVGALIALLVAAVALGLVLDEQGKGRGRDKALKATDVRLAVAVRSIQSSRREAVLIGCKTNQGQNNVLLRLIEFSIEEGRRRGRTPDPAALARTRELLKPITPQATRAVCDALLKRVEAGPPPPP